MNLLLNDEYAPITSEIGFIETSVDRAVDGFSRWMEPLLAKRDLRARRSKVTGRLRQALQHLLPLTGVEATRYLFVPTSAPWIAYFDNFVTGADASSVMSQLSLRCRTRSVRVVAIPHTRQDRLGKGRYGAAILEIYAPQETGFLNYLRTVCLINDGGKWSFEASGSPQPFEDIEAYNASSIRERFSFELLRNYLGALGVSAFDDDFYCPTGESILVEVTGARDHPLPEYELADARAQY